MTQKTYCSHFQILCALFAVSVLWLQVATAQAEVRYNVINLGELAEQDCYTSAAFTINNSGQVAGWYYTREHAVFPEFFTDTHAFFYDGTIVHDIGPFTGGVTSMGFGINSSGHVTGSAHASSGGSHAFIYNGTTKIDLGTFGGLSSQGESINDSGIVVGYAQTTNNAAEHAFIYDGVMHDIGTLGGNNSTANAINASGIVVGWAHTSAGIGHAFIYDGTMHDLGTLGGAGSQANAINNSGKVTGSSDVVGSLLPHAFLYDGVMHDLGTLGGDYSGGSGINSAGHVVGYSNLTINGDTHAFLYNGNQMLDLNSFIDPNSGWELQWARGINDSGQIVGVGRINGAQQGFLLTPIPEPSVISLFIIGGVGLLWRSRRKSKSRIKLAAREF